MAVTIKKSKGSPRPTPEDYLRALSYAWLALWGVGYLFFPPISTLEALDLTLRITWMCVTIIGALFAVIGALRRIDLKMEMPGLVFALLGPLFYCLTQVIFIVAPTETSGAPSTRYALALYALLPVLFALPRVASLFMEARRLKKVNTESAETANAFMQKLSTGSTPTGGSSK